MRLAHLVCLLQCVATPFLLAQTRPIVNSPVAWYQSDSVLNHSAKRTLPPELNPPGVLPRVETGWKYAYLADGRAQAQPAPMFTKSATYAASGAAPSSIVVADINGDGKPDEIVIDSCTRGNNSTCNGPGVVSVQFGNGDGTFQKATSYSSGGYLAIQVIATDVNGDGKLDLVVLNNCLNFECEGSTDDGSIGILLGNGDGTFQPAQIFNTDFDPSSMATGDVNQDGRTDLIVSYFCDPMDPSCSTGGLDVYLGNGDGTFQPPVDYSSGGYVTQEVLLADMNGDGQADLVVSNCGGPDCAYGTVGILLGNGDGTFQPAQTFLSGGDLASALAIGDVNGDGKPDVLVTGFAIYYEEPIVSVLLGNGDGTLQTAQTYSSGGYGCPNSGYCPISLALADVNGDGKLDVVAPFNVLLGNGDGTFQSPISYASDSCRRGQFVVADVNDDGKPDISIANYYASNGCSNVGLTVLLNKSTAATTTTLISSVNPAFVTQSITYTATVSSPYLGLVGGNVVFMSGGTSLGSAPLLNGQASLSTAFNTSKSYFVTAQFSGDANNRASKSSTLTQVVKRFPTSANVTSSLNPSSPGQTVTLTAAISSSYGAVPDGELVIFKDNGVALAAQRLSSGVATLNGSNLASGNHLITATYGGDSLFAATVSPALKQVVNKSPRK